MLLAPVTQVLPFPVEQEYPTSVAGVEFEDYLGWMRSCTLISATGCPALSVPGGFTPDGLPVGLQVIAARAPTAGCSRSATPSSRPPGTGSAAPSWADPPPQR